MTRHTDRRPIQTCALGPLTLAYMEARNQARVDRLAPERAARKQRFNEWHSFFKLCLMFQIASPISMYWGHRLWREGMEK